MIEDTRPDPKVQLTALYDIGRVMIEKSLPAIDIQIRSGGAVYLDAYSDTRSGPQTWDELLTVADPWIEALGLQRDIGSNEPYESPRHAGVWRRRLSAWGEFAGVNVRLYAAVDVDAPVAAVAS